MSVIAQLADAEPLSQVWFVHEYIQLQFQDQTVTILNTPKLKIPSGTVIGRSEDGFCDRLVSQIGQSISDAQLVEDERFYIRFTSGLELEVPLTKDAANGPEAIELPGAYIVFNT